MTKIYLTILAIVGVSGCTTLPPPQSQMEQWAYVVQENDGLFASHAPIIIHQAPSQSYNRIGKPSARINAHDHEEIYVDPNHPIYYVQRQDFQTDLDRYTNLIYRIHFERVPPSLIPFRLTAGDNVGLFIIITLNSQQKPVLITTVHACGCFLAFAPTNFLSTTAYPENWKASKRQRVYGESLPGRIDFPTSPGQYHVAVFLRHANHRVMNISTINTDNISDDYLPIKTLINPIDDLKTLPLNGHTTSFFETAGINKGYVKGTRKPFEFLLMSWWTLDSHVGVDKELGDYKKTGAIFYTSLKPWNRKKSDMWPFSEFFKFWGWRL